MGYYYGFDITYFIFVIPPLILAMWAQYKVKSTFKKYSKVQNFRGLTGASVARRILDMNGLNNVAIERVGGNLTDHYDPRSNVVRLSDSTYDSMSVGAIGVAAHECGHAVQHAQGYVPIKLRNIIVPFASISSNLAFPLAIVGLIMSWDTLIYAGIILFGAVVLFHLVTLPVEINASRRAIATLDENTILADDELDGAKKVLFAAAMTYIAAAATALGNLLRLLVLANNRRR